MNDPTRTVRMPIHCSSCGGLVTVQFRPFTGTGYSESSWPCPYCPAIHKIDVRGQVLSVEKRDR